MSRASFVSETLFTQTVVCCGRINSYRLFTRSFFPAARKKAATSDDADKKAMYDRLVSQVDEALQKTTGGELVDAAKDVLMEWLDVQFGSQVCGL